MFVVHNKIPDRTAFISEDALELKLQGVLMLLYMHHAATLRQHLSMYDKGLLASKQNMYISLSLEVHCVRSTH